MPTGREAFRALTEFLQEEGFKNADKRVEYGIDLIQRGGAAIKQGTDLKSGLALVDQGKTVIEDAASKKLKLAQFPQASEEAFTVFDKFGVSDLQVGELIFSAQLDVIEPVLQASQDGAEVPPPTPLGEPSAADVPLDGEKGELIGEFPFYPWRIDLETGRVFSPIKVDQLPKRYPLDLSIRQEGIALAMLAIKPDGEFVYETVAEAVPDVYKDLLDDTVDTARGGLLKSYRNSAGLRVIPSFMKGLNNNSDRWHPHFRRFMREVRSLPVYKALPEDEFVLVVKSVINREISFAGLLQKVGIILEEQGTQEPALFLDTDGVKGLEGVENGQSQASVQAPLPSPGLVDDRQGDELVLGEMILRRVGAGTGTPAVDNPEAGVDLLAEEIEEVEFETSDEKTYLFAFIVRDQNAQEVRSRRLSEKGFAPKDIERLNGIMKELEARIRIEDSVVTALEISDDLKTYQAHERVVIKLVQDNKNMVYLLRLFPTDKGVALNDVFLEMVEAMERGAMQRKAALRQPARGAQAQTSPASGVPMSPPRPTAPDAQQRNAEIKVDPKLILNLSETSMLGRLMTNDTNWHELLNAWRNNQGVTIEDEQHGVIRRRVLDLIREEQKAGRDPNRYLRVIMTKVFAFAYADFETRQAIISAQTNELASLFFELFLPFSNEDVRFFAREFHDRFVSS